jgi:hypothetical protein
MLRFPQSRGAGMAESVYEIAYQEAIRAITEQRAGVESLRDRSLTMFAIAISSNAFLGGVALKDSKPHGMAWGALGLLVVLGVLALLILSPRRFTFILTPRIMIQEYAEGDSPADVSVAYREFSLNIDRYYDQE